MRVSVRSQRRRGGYVVVVTVVGCGSRPPRCNRSGANVGKQISDGDGVIAMWAGAAGTEPTAKHTAFVTPLLAEESCFACGALVDDRRGGQAVRQAKTQFVCRPLATTESTLTAGVRAVQLTAMSSKGTLAGSAYTLVDRSPAIVTQRGGPRSVAGVAAWTHRSSSVGGRDERGGPGWRLPRSDRRPPGPDARPRPAVG